jgi:hypothetical protein
MGVAQSQVTVSPYGVGGTVSGCQWQQSVSTRQWQEEVMG